MLFLLGCFPWMVRERITYKIYEHILKITRGVVLPVGQLFVLPVGRPLHAIESTLAHGENGYFA